MSFFRVVAAVGLALVFSGTGSQMTAQTPRAKASSSASIDQAKAYCTSTGGELELRHAVFGTNNPQQDWLWLTGVQSFCQYTLSSDGSRIHLSLQTLFVRSRHSLRLRITPKFLGMDRATEIRPRFIARNWAERKSEPRTFLAAAGCCWAVSTKLSRPACFRTTRRSIPGDFFITQTASCVESTWRRC